MLQNSHRESSMVAFSFATMKMPLLRESRVAAVFRLTSLPREPKSVHDALLYQDRALLLT